MNHPLQCRLWNGLEFAPAEGVPFSDRGFRYGMSVFESIRISDGRPDFLSEHLTLLGAAAQQCHLPIPRGALDKIPGLLRTFPDNGFARLYVTAGDGAPSDPATLCRVVVLFEERPRSLAESYRLVRCASPHIPLFGGYKTANYWFNAEALSQARSRNAQEALLFHPQGQLISACMANVFVRTREGWRTPSRGCGARGGVVRDWVLNHFDAKEGRLIEEDLSAATAIFLTNSWIGIQPVESLDHGPLEMAAEVGALRSAFESRTTS